MCCCVSFDSPSFTTWLCSQTGGIRDEARYCFFLFHYTIAFSDLCLDEQSVQILKQEINSLYFIRIYACISRLGFGRMLYYVQYKELVHNS